MKRVQQCHWVNQHKVIVPGKNDSNEVFRLFSVLLQIKLCSFKRNKHGCFIRVTDCSIRVFRSLLQGIGQKWDQA